ncbi:hypothetical protein RQP46_010163 [Phenoliferia psychrophenolica]
MLHPVYQLHTSTGLTDSAMPLTLPPTRSDKIVPLTTAVWPHDALFRFDHAFQVSFSLEVVEVTVEVEGEGECEGVGAAG